ncbi:hypothetical protein D3C76_1596820 [compost metagenome]
MITHFFGHHDIADLKRAGQATGRTGVDHHVRLAVFQQQGGPHGRRNLTDAGLQQRHVNAADLAGIDFTARALNGLTVFDLIAQQGDFLLHCADDAYFHK